MMDTLQNEKRGGLAEFEGRCSLSLPEQQEATCRNQGPSAQLGQEYWPFEDAAAAS